MPVDVRKLLFHLPENSLFKNIKHSFIFILLFFFRAKLTGKRSKRWKERDMYAYHCIWWVTERLFRSTKQGLASSAICCRENFLNGERTVLIGVVSFLLVHKTYVLVYRMLLCILEVETGIYKWQKMARLSLFSKYFALLFL